MLIGIFMAFDPQRPPLDWKSATWLPVYLIGMGIISWQGQYSGAASGDKHPLPPTNTFNIPFWWDMLVVAGFSLIIYFWAMRVQAAPGGDAEPGQPAGRRGARAKAPALSRLVSARRPHPDDQGGASLRRAFG